MASYLYRNQPRDVRSVWPAIVCDGQVSRTLSRRWRTVVTYFGLARHWEYSVVIGKAAHATRLAFCAASAPFLVPSTHTDRRPVTPRPVHLRPPWFNAPLNGTQTLRGLLYVCVAASSLRRGCCRQQVLTRPPRFRADNSEHGAMTS